MKESNYWEVNICKRGLVLHLFLLTLITCIGCFNNRKLIEEIEFQELTIIDSPAYNSHPDIFMPVFLDSLKLGLRNNYFPNFIIDECLDMHFPYEYSPHSFISTRYMLFEQLNEKEIKRIIKLSKKYDLTQKCKRDATGVWCCIDKEYQIKNSQKSTLQLLNERLCRIFDK